MRLWRLSRRPFATLDGRGAERYGGRWNRPGRAMVYAAVDAALAVLEVRVHLDLPFELLPDDYVLAELDTGNASVEEGPMPAEAEKCAEFGDRWLRERRTTLLLVPSVIVPQSNNVLINPQHPASGQVQVERLHRWRFDSRLF